MVLDIRNGHAANGPSLALRPSPLLPEGSVLASRWDHSNSPLRQLLEHEPNVFGPGVYDPSLTQLAMYYGIS